MQRAICVVNTLRDYAGWADTIEAVLEHTTRMTTVSIKLN
jgi:hypothetical protein